MKEIITLNKNIDLDVKIPGSKSITNRAFVISSLAKGKSKILEPLFSDDTKYLLEALDKCGIDVDVKGDIVNITGQGSKYDECIEDIYIGFAGTTQRFLTSLLCFGKGTYKITCEERMTERPIGDLVEGLKSLGANIKYTNKTGFPPLEVSESNLKGGKIQIKGDKSSQYLSSVLMIAPLLKEGLEVQIIGELVSKPYIDTTVKVMQDFGVEIFNENYKKFIVPGEQSYKKRKFLVQGDASSASYFTGACAISGGRLNTVNVGYNCDQGDIEFAFLLEKMGANVTVKKNSTIIKSTGKLKGIKCDLNRTPDVVQTLVMCALFAEGETLIENVGNLRIKETDRLYALETELKKIGANVTTGKDWIKIVPVKAYKPAVIETYNDHRMAMSFALAGLKIPGIRINNPDVVTKSFPTFWEEFDKLY